MQLRTMIKVLIKQEFYHGCSRFFFRVLQEIHDGGLPGDTDNRLQ